MDRPEPLPRLLTPRSPRQTCSRRTSKEPGQTQILTPGVLGALPLSVRAPLLQSATYCKIPHCEDVAEHRHPPLRGHVRVPDVSLYTDCY